jgi:hypothetical protein
MTKYTLNVEIAKKDLHNLVDAKYTLCLAKDVEFNSKEEKGNVVFSSVTYDELAQKLMFEWEENYEVGGTAAFDVGTPSIFLLVYLPNPAC